MKEKLWSCKWYGFLYCSCCNVWVLICTEKNGSTSVITESSDKSYIVTECIKLNTLIANEEIQNKSNRRSLDYTEYLQNITS